MYNFKTLLLLLQFQYVYQQVTIKNDEYVGEMGRVYNKLKTVEGSEFQMMNEISKLELLWNDKFTPDAYTTCQQDMTSSRRNKKTSIKDFEEVAKASGITHVHRYERPLRPNCLFDYVILDDAVNSTVSKMYGELCIMEMLSAGAAVGDYDNDGLDDIFFTVAHDKSLLYRNNGDGTFDDVTLAANLGPAKFGSGAGWIDVDSDGDLDLYVTTIGDTRNYLYINHGGYFTEEGLTRGVAIQFPNKRKLASMTPNFGDFDLDGYMDIFTTEWNYNYMMQNVSATRLFRNLGGTKPGYFEDVTDKAGVNMDNKWRHIRNRHSFGTHTFGASFTDLNNDDYPELLVIGDFGQATLFWNNKDGTFKDCTKDCGITGFTDAMGLALGDVNKDGFIDLFISGIYWTSQTCKIMTCGFGSVGNSYYENNNGTSFTDKATQLGIDNSYWAWGASFMDYNNDGELDLAVTNGFDSSSGLDDYYGKKNSQLFKNNGLNKPMTDVAKESGIEFEGLGRGLLVFDFDNDGDEDILMTSNVGPPLLYKNNIGDNNWIRINVKEKCLQNPKQFCDSHGARVTITAWDGMKQMQLIGSKSHFMGQSELTAHFGLGQRDGKLKIEVYWPMSKQTVIQEQVDVNQFIRVVKPNNNNKLTKLSTLSKCQKLSISEIKTQPNIGKVTINQDKKSVTYDPVTMTLFDIGKQIFTYSVEVSPNTTQSVQTGMVTLDFRVSPNMYLPCTAGRQITPGVTREPTDDRRLDAVSNNMDNIHWGSTSENLIRLSGHAYGDNISEPAGACSPQQKMKKSCPFPHELSGIGSNRPSPRLISNELMKQVGNVFSKRNMSDFTMHFGQFVAHDLDHTSPLPRFEHQYYENHVWMPITVPKGDSHFDPFSTGKENIPFVRSSYNRCTGMYPGKISREQGNSITAFLDANMVYGSSLERCSHLREYKNGRMKLGPSLLMPKNNAYLANENPVQRPTEELYLAGDVRANVQPGLTAIHTLFVREHNRLAYEYHLKNPTATDEKIFQKARRLVIAETQSIMYNEYLPALLGGKQYIPDYTGYKKNINPGISTEFSTAAFRYGHSEVNSVLFRLHEDGSVYKHGHVLLRDAYFKPNLIENEGGIDPILRGAINFRVQETDLLMVDEMRNALFPTSAATPGKSSGFDLAAINIQRGRDHGIPDLNTVRQKLGLKAYTSFDEITADKELAKRIQEVYGNLENIDLFVGGLAEDHVTGSELGETFHKILVEQFIRLRDGDRFWYEAHLTKEEIKEVEATTMGKMIRMNTAYQDCPDDVFFATQRCSGVKDHQCIPILLPTSDYMSMQSQNEKLTKETNDQDYTIQTLIIVAAILGFACLVCLLFAIRIAIYSKFTDNDEKKPQKGVEGPSNETGGCATIEMGSSNRACEA